MKKIIALGIIALSLAGTASAQVKPEEQIKYRQAGYSFMSWNMGKIKANLEGEYNAEQVQAAANAVAAIAGSGMGALYGPGTDKDIGKIATNFNTAAADLAKVAAGGDKAAVQKAFGATGETCKACHDKYRME